MPQRIIFLGTGAAVADAGHENSHLLVQSGSRIALVDCPVNPIPGLKPRGIELATGMTEVILTHFHPDHVSGFVVMLQTAWLLGRKQELPVYGLPDTLDRAEKLLDLFDPGDWPGMFPVRFNRIPPAEMHLVIDTPELYVVSSPVEHLIPTIGLRFEFPQIGKTVTYSSDTEPASSLVRLAQGADVLIHESTGASRGHSSARQAGEIARQARAKKLFLTHYQTWARDPKPLVEEAKTTFGGEVVLALDEMEIDWPSSG